MNTKQTSILFAALTLGCKLNQYDTNAISDSLFAGNWIQTESFIDADVIILNTCTVTNNSDREAFKLIKSLHKKNPRALLVVFGCLVEGEGLSSLKNKFPNVSLFIGNAKKYDTSEIIKIARDKFPDKFIKPERIIQKPRGGINILREKKADFIPLDLIRQKSLGKTKSRAFVKIQDGCNLRCTYCIVPFVRGKNRSVAPDLILPYLKNLTHWGYPEAVLTGIHIGTYGKDFSKKGGENPGNLLGLLRMIETENLNIKIRLSSLDSNEIPGNLLAFLVSSKIIQPHLHIPLQSGSDKILNKMNRLYSRKEFSTIVEKIAGINPDVMIGTDIIVGFPGESRENFEETKKLFLDLPIHYAHVFSYSTRKNTRAAEMADQIPRAEIQSRSRLLREVSKEKLNNFTLSQINKVRDSIVLNYDLLHKSGPETGHRILTDNYLKLNLKAARNDIQRGKSIKILISNDNGKSEPFAIPADVQ